MVLIILIAIGIGTLLYSGTRLLMQSKKHKKKSIPPKVRAFLNTCPIWEKKLKILWSLSKNRTSGLKWKGRRQISSLCLEVLWSHTIVLNRLLLVKIINIWEINYMEKVRILSTELFTFKGSSVFFWI